MSEVPLEAHADNSQNGDEPLPVILEVLNSATIIERAHAKVREYEELLTQLAIEVSPVEFEDTKSKTLAEINAEFGFVEETLVINGIIPFTGANVKDGIKREDSSDLTEFRLNISDVTARSLGYAAFSSLDNGSKVVTLKHKAMINPIPSNEIDDVTVYQKGPIYLPIDGTVDVQLYNEQTPPNLKSIDVFTPGLLEDIDDALFNGETPTKQLRSLSKIDISKFTVLNDRGGDAIKEEIVKHINQCFDLSLLGIVYIAGTKDVVLPVKDGFAVASLEKFRLSGVPKGIVFSPIDNRFAVKIDTVLHGQGLQEMFVVLNSRITLTAATPLMVRPQ